MTIDFENQLDIIRVDLYERTKGMTNDEAANVTNTNARKIAEQYGIKLTNGVSVNIERKAGNDK